MKYVLLTIAWSLLLTGCTAPRSSRFDEFEKVKVDKMVGNQVGLSVLSRTVVCLNGMREARWLPPTTNLAVTSVTNYVPAFSTNVTVSSSANQQLTLNTNAVAMPILSLPEGTAAAVETNQASSPPTSSPDTGSRGVNVSSTRNESVATGPNQMVIARTLQTITQLNCQVTTNTNGQSLTSGTNQLVTVETNLVVTILTNAVITLVTNVTVLTPEEPVLDYYLYTEIAPPDFTVQPGESLVVLVDGVRYAFAQTQPQAGWASRRGFLTTFYRVPPEVLSGIANGREVKLRIRSASGVLERRVSEVSRNHFREFLVNNFGTPRQAGKAKAPKVAAPKAAS